MKLKNSLGFAQIPLLIGLLLMALAIPLVTKLAENNQDNRNLAAGNHSLLPPTSTPAPACAALGQSCATLTCCVSKENPVSCSKETIKCVTIVPTSTPTPAGTCSGRCSSFTCNSTENEVSKCGIGALACCVPKPTATPTRAAGCAGILDATECGYTPACKWNGSKCIAYTPLTPVPTTCTPGDKKCNGNNAESCNLVGSGYYWQGVSCAAGCNATTKACNPVATVTPVVKGCPAITLASGVIPAMADNQLYCQSPFLLGSQKWQCLAGTSKVIDKYPVTANCLDLGEEVWGHLLAFAQQNLGGLTDTQCFGKCNSNTQRWCSVAPVLKPSDISFDVAAAVAGIVGKAAAGGGTVNLTAAVGLVNLGGTNSGCTSCTSQHKISTLSFTLGNVVVKINVSIPVAVGTCTAYLDQVTAFTTELWGHTVAFAQQKIMGLSGNLCYGKCNSNAQRWCADAPTLKLSDISYDGKAAIEGIVSKAIQGGGEVNVNVNVGLSKLGGTNSGCTSCASKTITYTLTETILNVKVNVLVNIPVAEGSCTSYLAEIQAFVNNLPGYLLSFAQQKIMGLPSNQCFGTCNSSTQKWCADAPSLTQPNISYNATAAVAGIVSLAAQGGGTFNLNADVALSKLGATISGCTGCTKTTKTYTYTSTIRGVTVNVLVSLPVAQANCSAQPTATVKPTATPTRPKEATATPTRPKEVTVTPTRPKEVTVTPTSGTITCGYKICQGASCSAITKIISSGSACPLDQCNTGSQCLTLSSTPAPTGIVQPTAIPTTSTGGCLHDNQCTGPCAYCMVSGGVSRCVSGCSTPTFGPTGPWNPSPTTVPPTNKPGNPTNTPTIKPGNPTNTPTLTPKPLMCISCPNDFQCMKSSITGMYKWFSSYYQENGYVLVTGNEAVTCGGLNKPTYLGRSSGDADCDGQLTINDVSIWRSEFITGNLGASFNSHRIPEEIQEYHREIYFCCRDLRRVAGLYASAGR